MSTDTPAEKVMKLFGRICKVEDDLAKLNDSDGYWVKREQFTNLLRDFLTATNWGLLPKPQLLNFLSLCSRYRPLQPHVILTRIAIQYEEMYL